MKIGRLMPLATNEDLTDAVQAKFAKMIYGRTGIRISPQKKALLANRLRRRLRETGIDDFDAYCRHLQKVAPADPEWDAFLQEITTHETYLFRDPSNWDWFRGVYLPDVVGQVRAGKRKKSLRIWSAAASTGDEAHTIACCITAALVNQSGWDVRIVGTDIGQGALDEARQGVFGERAMKLVPDDLKRRYFDQAKDAKIWKAKETITRFMDFRQHNLLHPLKAPSFDVVFLKNVLIYFDTDSKKTAIQHVVKLIKPGGLLLVSGSEGISDLDHGMDRVHPWLYQKPAS